MVKKAEIFNYLVSFSTFFVESRLNFIGKQFFYTKLYENQFKTVIYFGYVGNWIKFFEK